MCIRDSQIGAVRIHPSNPNTAWVAAYGDIFKPNKERGVYTVSYTHLRAHETVLDLVCRLLLEKK